MWRENEPHKHAYKNVNIRIERKNTTVEQSSAHALIKFSSQSVLREKLTIFKWNKNIHNITAIRKNVSTRNVSTLQNVFLEGTLG